MSDLTRFSRIDADRILRRAAELEGAQDVPSLSLAELRAIADEAGFGAHALERALTEARNAANEESRITWRDRKGIRFSVVSGGGGTEIRVKVSRLTLRRGRWISWVKSAADRLDALASIVARTDMTDRPEDSRETL